MKRLTTASARLLVGRRIVGYDPRQWSRGRGRGMTSDPVIILDNGARLVFSASETESTEYGIDVLYVPKGKS